MPSFQGSHKSGAIHKPHLCSLLYTFLAGTALLVPWRRWYGSNARPRVTFHALCQNGSIFSAVVGVFYLFSSARRGALHDGKPPPSGAASYGALLMMGMLFVWGRAQPAAPGCSIAPACLPGGFSPLLLCTWDAGPFRGGEAHSNTCHLAWEGRPFASVGVQGALRAVGVQGALRAEKLRVLCTVSGIKQEKVAVVVHAKYPTTNSQALQLPVGAQDHTGRRGCRFDSYHRGRVTRRRPCNHPVRKWTCAALRAAALAHLLLQQPACRVCQLSPAAALPMSRGSYSLPGSRKLRHSRVRVSL